MILRAMLSKRLVEAIVSAERLDLLVFPVEPV